MIDDQSSRPSTESSDLGEAIDGTLQAERDKAAGFLANWQRAEADLQNYKRRVDQEKADLARYGNALLIRDLLVILDDLDRALANVGDAESTWVQGVELTRKNLLAVLERHGVSEISADHQKFDPNLHEAVLQGPGPDGQVIDVIKKGFRLYDRVLRPAMVRVGDGS